MTSDEDLALFLKEMDGVTPLTHSDRVLHDRPAPQPRPRQRELDERAVMRELASGEYDPAWLETGEELLYRSPGIKFKTFSKLRRGKFAVEASIDLHAMNRSAANNALAEFIDDCTRLRRRCIKVIHGKGLRSKQKGPVLKRMVNDRLRFHSDVLAFASAPPSDGGTGAIYVLLRRI